MTYTLILLRHGESTWNAENLFTGWVDVPLSEKGEREARRGGQLLREAGVLPEILHTSLMRRAIMTANLALDAADRHWIPVRRDWRLNERHYGALQGKDKKQTLKVFGEEQFMLWRRSYSVPPPIEADSQYFQNGDPRYADLGDEMPRTECLKDVIARMLPYWESAIVPDLAGGDTVLIAAAAAEMHPAAVLKGAELRSIRTRLETATADARAAGVLAVPAVRIGGRVFHGDGELELAAGALA